MFNRVHATIGCSISSLGVFVCKNQSIIYHYASLLWLLKFKYCKKAIKFEKKISHLVLKLLIKTLKKSGTFFQIFVASLEYLNLIVVVFNDSKVQVGRPQIFEKGGIFFSNLCPSYNI